jgi:hypothetical protein
MNDDIYSPRLFQAGSESQPQPTDGEAQARRRRLFGPPLLLEGEDGAAYQELLVGVWDAVKPADTIEEIFTLDVVSLEWEVLRWRRLKLSLVRKHGIDVLENVLRAEVDYDAYFDYVVDDVAQILEEYLPKDHVNAAQTLAQRFARNEKGAVEIVSKVLARADLKVDALLDRARNRKVKDLVQAYARREPDAVTLVDDALTAVSKSIELIMADALANKLDFVERVDRLTAIAEGRRNASLREIDRRRPILAETLRRRVQQIEHDELETVEAPATGESAT